MLSISCTSSNLISGLERAHPESYHSFMWENFFKHIDINPANAHILDGNAKNLEIECENYEKMISDAGGIQLFIGGKRIFTVHQTILVIIGEQDGRVFKTLLPYVINSSGKHKVRESKAI